MKHGTEGRLDMTVPHMFDSDVMQMPCERRTAVVSDVDLRAGRVSPLPHPTDLPLGTCFKLAAEAEDLAQ